MGAQGNPPVLVLSTGSCGSMMDVRSIRSQRLGRAFGGISGIRSSAAEGISGDAGGACVSRRARNRAVDEPPLCLPVISGKHEEIAPRNDRNGRAGGWSGKWSRINPWLELLLPVLVKPERLPFDKLKLTDFAACLNAMIRLAQDMLSGLPSHRLLNLKFEDMRAEPGAQLRKLIRFIDPSLEDEARINKASAIPRQTPSRFARLPAAEQSAVAEACPPGLVRLGYPV